ncbi:MAG: YtxH domain-containing protein [Thainema sp.]
MSEKRTGAFITGMVLGAAVGAITGLLTAPKTGRETRRILKKSADALPELAEDLSTSIQLQTGRLSDSALRRWDETLIRLRDAIAAGQMAQQEEAQFLQQYDQYDQVNRRSESEMRDRDDSRDIETSNSA